MYSLCGTSAQWAPPRCSSHLGRRQRREPPRRQRPERPWHPPATKRTLSCPSHRRDRRRVPVSPLEGSSPLGNQLRANLLTEGVPPLGGTDRGRRPTPPVQPARRAGPDRSETNWSCPN